MESLTAVLLTILATIMLGVSFAMGWRFGQRHGFKAGRRDAITDLMLAKDPEAWDKAHFLEVEAKVKAEISEIPTKAFEAKRAGR